MTFSRFLVSRERRRTSWATCCACLASSISARPFMCRWALAVSATINPDAKQRGVELTPANPSSSEQSGANHASEPDDFKFALVAATAAAIARLRGLRLVPLSGREPQDWRAAVAVSVYTLRRAVADTRGMSVPQHRCLHPLDCR